MPQLVGDFIRLPTTSLPPYNNWNKTRLWIPKIGTKIHNTIRCTIIFMCLTKYPITLCPATQPWHHPTSDSYTSQHCLFDSRQNVSFTNDYFTIFTMMSLLPMTLLKLYNDESFTNYSFTIMTLLQLYNDNSFTTLQWRLLALTILHNFWMAIIYSRKSCCNASFDLILLLLNSCLMLYLNLILPRCKIFLVKPIPKKNKIPFNLPMPAKHM